MDLLVIDHFVLHKSAQPNAAAEGALPTAFGLD
jgi:hypothetical protein